MEYIFGIGYIVSIIIFFNTAIVENINTQLPLFEVRLQNEWEVRAIRKMQIKLL